MRIHPLICSYVILQKLQESSSDEVTELLAQFGEGCVDRVSVQIDRIEEVLKVIMEIDHEIFSTIILSLPLIQEGQLSVSGERMCTLLVNRLQD